MWPPGFRYARSWPLGGGRTATTSSGRSASASASALSINSPCGWGRTLAAGAPFYGTQPSAADSAKIRTPINAQYGELDSRITDGWPAFDAALSQAGIPHEGHIYKGANHGFHNDTTPRYDEAAAKEAWQRTLDWFNKYLRT